MKRLLVLALFSALAMGQAGAQTVDLHNFSVSYVSRARGLDAGEVSYTFAVDNRAYQATSERRLTGMARMFLHNTQDFDYAARGAIGEDGVVEPQSYQHQDYGKRHRLVRVTFAGDQVITVAAPPMGMGHPPATPEQKRGTIDQVSLLLQMLVARGDPCRQTYHVFMDGRSRFDLVLTPNGHQQVSFAGYHGAVDRCVAAYQPIAGFGNPQQPAQLTFMFAHVGAYAVPVSIEMPTDAVGIVQLQVQSFHLS